MSKKSQMQKQVSNDEVEYEIGEQMSFIDLTPEELKAIEPTVKKYRKIVKERVALTAQEKQLKEEIKEFVHSHDFKRNADGIIKFKCHELTVEVIPQDEKIKIKEASESEVE